MNQSETETLIKKLESDDKSQRMEAVQALGKIKR